MTRQVVPSSSSFSARRVCADCDEALPEGAHGNVKRCDPCALRRSREKNRESSIKAGARRREALGAEYVELRRQIAVLSRRAAEIKASAR
jgi:hypothetical protein